MDFDSLLKLYQDSSKAFLTMRKLVFAEIKKNPSLLLDLAKISKISAAIMYFDLYKCKTVQEAEDAIEHLLSEDLLAQEMGENYIRPSNALKL